MDIDVLAVNDQPTLTLPADTSVSEDTSLAISGIAIADVDAASSALQVTLEVSNGTLTLGDTTGLTFSTGDGSDDASLVFTGSLTDINTALTTLSYQGNLNYVGTDTLNVTVNDQGNTGSGGALQDTGSVDIDVLAVNDQPTLTLPADTSVSEDTSLAISGIAIADVDAASSALQVTLSVSNGTLTLGDTTGLTFSTGDGTDDASLVFTGSLTDINTALATLSYKGDLNYVGTDTLNVTVNDQGNTGSGGALQDTGSVDIDVLAVNDQPTLTLPADTSVSEDTSLAISGIAIADVDAASGALQVTLSVSNGTLTLGDTTGLTFSTGDGTDDASLVFTGSLTDINTALTTLSYQGNLNYVGTDTLNVTVNDQGNTGSGGALQDTGSVDIEMLQVNDAPTSLGISDIKVPEDTIRSLIDLHAAFEDPEDADADLRLSVVNVSNPQLFSNVRITPGGVLVLRYAPDANGTAEVTVQAEDTQGLATQETFLVEVTPVNDAPVTARDAYSVSGDEVLTVTNPGILSNDSDVDGNPLTAVLVAKPGHGKLTLNSDGSFRYVPDPSFVGTDSFSYAANDGEALSERQVVVIKVLAPTSPVDTSNNNSTDPGATSQDSQQDAATDNINELINAELPTGLSSGNDEDSANLRQRSVVSSDSAGMELPGQTLLTIGLDDAEGVSDTRTTSRGRYFDDLQDYALTRVETTAAAIEVASEPVLTPAFADLDDLDITVDTEGALHRITIGSAVGITTGLTVGYVFWTIRAGYLLTSLIAQMPAWRLVDPLPILNSLDSTTEHMDSESLESIVEASAAG